MTNGLWLDFDVHADQTGWDNMLDKVVHEWVDEGQPGSIWTTTMASVGYNGITSTTVSVLLSLPSQPGQ